MPIPKEAMFEFLDGLRESGVTNMFGACPYLVEKFDVTPGQARVVLAEWMRTFFMPHPEAGR